MDYFGIIFLVIIGTTSMVLIERIIERYISILFTKDKRVCSKRVCNREIYIRRVLYRRVFIRERIIEEVHNRKESIKKK